jgi:predicted RNA-binding Zn ribbon-like protein
VNFDSYTDCGVEVAVDLVNSWGHTSGELLTDVVSLRDLLKRHQWSYIDDIGEPELEAVRSLRPRLRAIFEATDDRVAAELINTLLVETQALPQLTDHDGEPWHLHYTSLDAPLVSRLAAETAMGLAAVLRVGGRGRMNTCADDTCGDVFVDASRNHSRRYCSDTCANRLNVAAHRRRRRAAEQQPEPVA